MGEGLGGTAKYLQEPEPGKSLTCTSQGQNDKSLSVILPTTIAGVCCTLFSTGVAATILGAKRFRTLVALGVAAHDYLYCFASL